MKDKNGIEIKTGMTVKVSNAYFKNDNGYYFVENSPGDANWCGSDYCMKKISKKGKISTAKYSLCFWPISAYVNDRWKRAAADEWNKEHAEIEVVEDIDRTEVAEHFERAAESGKTYLEKFLIWNFGEDSKVVKDQIKLIAHYESVAGSIRA